MGREIDDAVIGEGETLDGGLAGVGAEMNVGGGHTEVARNALQFVGRIRQLRQRLRQSRTIDTRRCCSTSTILHRLKTPIPLSGDRLP
jgi:hypothetical protein